MPDGLGFYFGFVPKDGRRIDVRYEHRDDSIKFGCWASYLGGQDVGTYGSKAEAEAAALEFAAMQPEPEIWEGPQEKPSWLTRIKRMMYG